jgi:hypothetical protein
MDLRHVEGPYPLGVPLALKRQASRTAEGRRGAGTCGAVRWLVRCGRRLCLLVLSLMVRLTLPQLSGGHIAGVRRAWTCQHKVRFPYASV